MAAYDFPALGFDPAPGSAPTVNQMAGDTGRNAAALGGSRDRLHRLRASAWTGQAAGAFSTDLARLPTDLDRAAVAFGTISGALGAYAVELSSAQDRAGWLERRAAEARAARDTATRTAADLARGPAGETDTQQAQREVDARAASSRADAADAELAAILREAEELQDHVRNAADRTAGQIYAAADQAPYHEPGLVQRAWNGTKQWVRDHADVLRTVSGVLKVITAIAAVAAFIPVIGQFVAVIGIATGAAALGIDALLKLSTGEGSWAALGLDLALTVVPLGRVAKVVSRPFAAAARGLNRAFPGVGRALARGGDAIGDGIRPVLTAARRGNAEGALDNAHPSTMGPGGGLGGRINLTPAQAQHLGQAQKDGQAIVDQVIHQRFPGKQIKVDYTTHPIDPAAADEVNRAIGRMAADYPEVFRDIKRIETQDLDALYPQQGYLAVAVPRGGSTTLSGAHLDAGVYMDAQFLGDATAATKQLIADVKSGFTFPDGGSIEAVALHEFGHQLHFRIDVVPGGPAKLDAAIENALHKVGTMKPFDSSIYDNLTLRDPMVQTAIEQHVSGYGATYSQEVIAEAFAESRLAPRPRDFAVEIRKVIDSFLPKP